MAQQTLDQYLQEGFLDPEQATPFLGGPPQGELRDETGRVIDRSGSGGTGYPGLPGGIQTMAAPDTQDTSDSTGPTDSPDNPPIDEPPVRTEPPEARHGGIKDPATGDASVGQPGPKPTPPSTDYSQLNDIITQLLAQQQADRKGSADYKNNIRNTVLSLIKSGSAPVDPNDPMIASATQAFRGEGERALALLQEKEAERRAATGRTSGSVESSVKGGFENLGNAVGSFKSNAMLNEVKDRRAQLMQALQLGAGVMTAEEQQSLQEELGLLDRSIQQFGLGQQDKQFYDRLGFDMGKENNSLDKLLADYLLHGGA